MGLGSNWLEELVAEWLSVDGFLVEVLLPIQLGPQGGRAEPDVLGARVDTQGRLLVRHCETAVWPAGNPQPTAHSYGQKFRPAIVQGVERHFRRLFGVPQAAAACYEQWIIFCGISQPARAAVLSIVPGARLLLLDEFVRTEVMPAITRWRATQQAGSNTTPSLPADKWLLKLMEWLDYLGMLH